MKSIKKLRFEIKKQFVVIRGEVEGPLRSIWFVFRHEEFQAFADGSRWTFEDGYHKLNNFVEYCTFYDLQIPSGEYGEAKVPYFNVIIPMFLRRAIARLAKRVVPTLDDGDVYEIEPTPERVERWMKLYGQGTGSVEVEVAEQVREQYEANVGRANFDENVARLKQIALNSTSCWLHNRKVHLSYDFAGFFFTVPGMHGGLINHGTEESPDWSLHT
jgi:hypothetical protein